MTLRFVCPGCGKRYEVPESRVGKRAACLKCRRMLRLPERSPPPGVWGKAAEIPASTGKASAPARPDPDEEEIIDAEPVIEGSPAKKSAADRELDAHPDWPEDLTFDLDELEEEDDLVPLELVESEVEPVEQAREVTVVIGERLFRRVRDRATARGDTFDDAVEDALRLWLRQG